jgi:predicted NACHT family NTPase
LDEVREEDSEHILKSIRQTSEQFNANQFVITCRIAAQEYTFEQFTEVEIADFSESQIGDFVKKWFQAKAPMDETKAGKFIEALKKYRRLQDLATNPLLLTLLCLVFEDQTAFPTNRTELYKEGLDILLKKWDSKRGIKRDNVYRELPLQCKEDLLSQIAFATFDLGEYFFKQKSVEEQIQKYMFNLPHASTPPETLKLDSKTVLESIEAQHGLLIERARGIYSFSHLTFQEYFTARHIKEKSDDNFRGLVSHITENRWREIFLLTVEMVENADQVLQAIKYKIDGILAQDRDLQEFLAWVERKSCSVEAPYKPAAIRAFYLDLDRASNRVLAARDLTRGESARARARARTRESARKLTLNRDIDSRIGHDIARTLASARESARNLDFSILANDLANDLFLALTFACEPDININRNLDPQLQQELKHLKDQLPPPDNQESYEQWWKEQGQTWTEKLRQVMIQYRNIGHDRQFTKAQKELFQQYYDANRLLVACLNSSCKISDKVRAEIEADLLLPITTLQKRQPEMYGE